MSRILLGVTGGVGAFKAVLLLRALQRAGHEVRVVLSRNAARFVGDPTFHALCGHPPYRDGWDLSRSTGGELHIDLTDWAEALIVYPATANFVGGAAAGLADDLLKLTWLSFVGPRIASPAMHHRMAGQPAFARSLELLREDGAVVLDPVVGELASGEIGLGRLPEPEVALEALEAALSPKDLAGCHLVVSAGPTREPVDPVRFLSNPSTGRMGFAVARVAARRGARVTLVAGPVTLETPAGVQRVDVVTAAELATAVRAVWDTADVLVMAAAVADMRPAAVAGGKLKKGELPDALALEPTEDILAGLGRDKGDRVLVGFAMETGDLEARAARKLAAKNLDLLVANDLTVPGAGFAVPTNVVTILEEGLDPVALPRMSKDAVAAALLDRVVVRRARA